VETLVVCVGNLQQKMRTSTAEALSQLDMVGAVRDHRRFNYVCKVALTEFFLLLIIVRLHWNMS